MSTYLHTRIRDITDTNLRAVLAELCHCARWDLARHESGTIFHLLSSLFLERADALTPEYIPSPSWLETKVRKISSEAILDFCRELTALAHTSLEVFDRKRLLTLIRQCFEQMSQPPPPSVREELSDSERETRLIMQRRRNGSL